MKIAIYSRKSRQTNKGESIENQVQLCRQHAQANYGIDVETIVYEDEGFSGGHMDRPMFKKMIQDANANKFNVLMCYRLDRVSRSVTDFSSTLDMLQDKGIDFISIRESFDTSTPMGRAMIHIASVFAQLERETAAERIRDNMHALARSGRWLGGTTPTGFQSKAVIYEDNAGNKKEMFKLTPVKEELEKVKFLFSKYLEFDSLSKVETYCLQNDIKSRTGTSFSPQSIRHILLNPVYCLADNHAYNYFQKLGADISFGPEEFTGDHGLMVYNKTEQKRGESIKAKDPSEWIAAIGKHKGVISSKNWIKVQARLGKNKSKAIRRGTGKHGLLSGLLKCNQCGDYMRVRLSRKNKDGIHIYYYQCMTKERSRGVKCQSKNIKGNDLDAAIVKEIKSMYENNTKIMEYLSIKEKDNEFLGDNNKVHCKKIENKIKDKDMAIQNLISKLSKSTNDTIEKYIDDEITRLHKDNNSLKLKLQALEDNISEYKSEELSSEIIKDALLKFTTQFDNSDLTTKRILFRAIIRDISWDGDKVKINMYASLDDES